jgi:hypothetical protein
LIKRARDFFIGALIVSPWLVYQCVAVWTYDINWKHDLAYRIGKIDMENAKFWPKRKNPGIRWRTARISPPIILKSGETYYLHIEEETGGGRENTD